MPGERLGDQTAADRLVGVAKLAAIQQRLARCVPAPERHRRDQRLRTREPRLEQLGLDVMHRLQSPACFARLVGFDHDPAGILK